LFFRWLRASRRDRECSAATGAGFNSTAGEHRWRRLFRARRSDRAEAAQIVAASSRR
jgi:hypothetical protein